ncbi:MAG TPA: SNF2-related protein, partial [Gammaproteobacteria bacterium]|nr:SNF2-related protein [Gammaproteobacteria bacterium]
MDTLAQNPAPGMRAEIRDAEWRINKVDHSSDGGYLLSCEGLSELVRGKEALFLTNLESGLRILDPRETTLVNDTSAGHRASLLYLETLIRRSAPSDQRIHLGHRAALDQMPYQLDPALQALSQTRQRILIADAVGLGKTLEAGILVSELIARGRGRRILVLSSKAMLTQFQQEFWNRFTIPLVRLDSQGLQRLRNRIPATHNPFHYFDRSIISIDTLKKDIEYRHYLEQAYWDIIIIDEAQNVAERGSNSQRSQLAKLVATRSDSLIMLSATPHDGRPESFASLMNMLDPTAIPDPKDYGKEDYSDKKLVIRRFKKDVRDQLAGNFPEREISVVRASADEVEEAAYDRLMEVSFHTLDRGTSHAGQLFRTTLEKALFSSPVACLATIENRLTRLQKREESPEIREDIDTLQGLQTALKAVAKARFAKYQQLLRLLGEGEESLGWPKDDPKDRLVIFTESLVTLEFLEEHLPGDLRLKKNRLQVLRGDMRDKDMMERVEAFGKRDSQVRVLVCSDVASEGINLHHLCHRIIHFDIPWSLMVFQQRNGRVDRYGQTRIPQIRYLRTESAHPQVQGDTRILDILVEKDEQASRNLGDPSEFMGQAATREEQEELVAGYVEREGQNPDDISGAFADFLSQTQEQSEDPVAAFTPEGGPASTATDVREATCDPVGLFPDDFTYAQAAVEWFREAGVPLQAETDGQARRLALTAPRDLIERLRYLPREIRPEHDRFILTTDTDIIQQEVERARQEEDPWPDVQYLWPLHPVMQWLSDRALNAFGRHTAPVIRRPGPLAPDRSIVLLQGGFPNRRGHPVLQEWIAVEMAGREPITEHGLEAVVEWLDLRPGRLPNPAREGDTAFLQ